jgi:hypothetical protein
MLLDLYIAALRKQFFIFSIKLEPCKQLDGGAAVCSGVPPPEQTRKAQKTSNPDPH